MSSVIEVKNLSFSYNKLLALDDISFVVKKSDFIILTGPNGGGKSTLGNLIYGNLKPTTGIITKNGTTSLAPQKIIPKQSMPLSVSNFLKYHNHKYPIFQELYDAFEIEVIKNQQLIDLSGGWMQKVNLCNAIRLDYDIILLDEPDQNFFLY